MISYPIESARASKNIDKVVVSTDSDEIKDISIRYGASIPFMRPKELSDDLTPTVPVISHAVKKLIQLGWEIENVCCIYPCTPLLTPKILDSIFESMINKNHSFAYPVIKYHHPIQRAMKMNKEGKMEFFSPDHELVRTQDLEPAFHDAGQLYWGQKNAWLDQQKMHTDGIGVLINSWEAVDIDNDEDWKKAEMLKKTFN